MGPPGLLQGSQNTQRGGGEPGKTSAEQGYCSQERPKPNSEITVRYQKGICQGGKGRGDGTVQLSRGSCAISGPLCSPSNSWAGWEGDSVSASCGPGGLSPSGGMIPPKLFRQANASHQELGSGGGIHLESHYRASQAPCGLVGILIPVGGGGETGAEGSLRQGREILCELAYHGASKSGCCSGLVSATLDPEGHPSHLPGEGNPE